jgi:hypothetical protein
MVYRSSPLRAAFSFALKHVMDMPSLLEKEKLKIFVKRGPGSGSKALPARWLSITGGAAQPVLDDDKSRARSSLLSPEMGIQLLGVLNHIESEDHPHARILAAIDRSAIAYLKVLRLSDKRFVVKTRVRLSFQVVFGFIRGCFRLHSAFLRPLRSCIPYLSNLSTHPLFPLFSGVGITKAGRRCLHKTSTCLGSSSIYEQRESQRFFVVTNATRHGYCA